MSSLTLHQRFVYLYDLLLWALVAGRTLRFT